MKPTITLILLAAAFCPASLKGAEIIANHANEGIARYTPGFSQIYTPANGEIVDVAISGTSVFWSEKEFGPEGPLHFIKSSMSDGSGLSVIHSFVDPDVRLGGICVKNGRIYWATQDGIFHCALDGSGVEQVPIPNYLGTVDLKVTSAHIYWSYYTGGGGSSTGGAIYRCDLDGQRKATLFGNIGSAISIVVSNTRIYWLDIAAYQVFSGNLDGSDVGGFAVNPRARAMTANNEGIYVENDVAGNQHIVRYDLDGSNPSTFVTLNYSTTFGLESQFLSGTTAIVTSIAPANAIKFNSETGLSYYLEASETLGTDSWDVVDGPLAGTGNELKFFSEADKGKEFYRVVSSAE